MLELARADFAIIRWTSVNPGGPDDHFAVIRYGLRPDALSRTALSPIRLNRLHRSTTFRVLVTGLESRTTYYYRVASTDGAGMSDGMESGVGLFTTPAAGRRVGATDSAPPNRANGSDRAFRDSPSYHRAPTLLVAKSKQ